MGSLSSLDRRRFLQYLGVGALGAVGPIHMGKAAEAWMPLGTVPMPPGSAIRLKDVAAEKGILFGSATNNDHLRDDREYASLIEEQCAIITPTNELKMKYLRPGPDTFKFDNADWVVQWARSRNIQVHGHTLVYGDPLALPSWANGYLNRNNARDVMVKHVSTVVRHYAGKVRSWDVVNEALDWRANLRDDSIWFRLVGPDYLEIAYKTAGEADPNAMLAYNDHGIEWASQDDKRNGTLKVLENLISRKAPIHALGIQSHMNYEKGGFNPGNMRKFLSQVSDLGLKIRISEMDCQERESDVEIKDRDQAVAQFYADYLGTVLENKSVTVVETWNLTDRYTWLADFRPRRDGQPVRPLPFDDKMAPKPAFDAIARAFEHAPAR